MGDPLNIAVTGLNAAMMRVKAVSNNVANAATIGRLPTAEGGAATSYQPVRAVSFPISGNGEGLGVTSAFQNIEPAYGIASDPSSPLANEKGLVATPNVDIATEMVEAKMASVAYRANAAVIGASAKLDKYLLDVLA